MIKYIDEPKIEYHSITTFFHDDNIKMHEHIINAAGGGTVSNKFMTVEKVISKTMIKFLIRLIYMTKMP